MTRSPWPRPVSAAAKHLDLSVGQDGCGATCIRFLELAYLKNAFPGVEFVDVVLYSALCAS